MRPKILFGLALGALSSLHSGYAFAQPAGDMQRDTLIYILESVIVYGERAQNTLVASELTADQIQARNATTLADIFRKETGIIVTSGPKSESETKIRGLPASGTLVLVDGRPLNSGYYGKVDLSMLPVDNIAKVEVIKGPASAAYGANGTGGVINIVTKNGLETPETIAEGEFGESQFRKVCVNHSRQIGKTSFWLSGYENYSNGFRLSDNFEPTLLEDGGRREGSSYHKVGFDGKIGVRPSTRSLLSLSLGYHWARKDVAPTIYPWDGPSYREFPDWRRYSAALGGYWQVRPHLELKGVIFADAYADRFISYLNTARRYDQIEYDSKLENWTTGGSADGRFCLNQDHNLHASVSLRRDLMNKKPDIDEPWFARRTYTGTLFFEDTFRPLKQTEMTVGLGYHYFTSQEPGSPTSAWSPMICLSQRLPLGLSSHASYARAVRFPTINQLYGETSGNESLAPELADKYEVGLKRWFLLNGGQNYTSLELVYFRNDLKDLIYRESQSYQFRNIGAAQLHGWEMKVNWTLLRVFDGELSYAQVREADPEGILMEEVPEQTLRISLSLKTGFGTEFDYRYGYFNERTTYRTDFILPAYDIHDISISQRLSSSIKLRLQVSNFTGADYQEELGYPAPGRQFAVGLIFRR
jgi:vitamin B12 transporter